MDREELSMKNLKTLNSPLEKEKTNRTINDDILYSIKSQRKESQTLEKKIFFVELEDIAWLRWFDDFIFRI